MSLLLIILIWAVSGPIFGFSNTWQLIINTATTVLTFLMVFIIQNTINRDSLAMHLKLDELIRATDEARNRMIGSEKLSETVLDELERGEKKFLIDFSQTGYIDSSGLGVLVSLSKKIREQGGELRLANLNDDLKTLFELTKLDTLFQIADTRERALESF